MLRLITPCARTTGALTLLVLALALVFVPSASASHSFSDVPDAHPFHNEIAIFKDTNITGGCSATEFCPTNQVLRQAMAAFLTRALGLVVRPGESTQKGVPGSRVAMLDDDLTFVGTQDGALELSFNGLQGLRLEQGNGTIPNLIGGSGGNVVTGGVLGATIAGGGSPAAGNENTVTDNFGTIGGGIANRAGDNAGTTSDRSFTTVAGGGSNVASGTFAAVGGGFGNTASGIDATVPGGASNTASGTVSFAAGNHAKADDQGAFMWADSQIPDVFSPGLDTFSVRAAGGIWLGTTSTPSIGAGRFLDTSTGGHLTAGGAWTNSSDRALKTDFTEVDGRAILRALALMPIHSWSYKAEPGVRHVGPVAQDFKRAFGLGRGDEHIATIDAEGVALAAIKALHAENRALEARLAKLERQLARLAAKRR